MADLLIGVQTQDLPTIGPNGVSPSEINTGGMLIYSDRGVDDVVPIYKADQIPEIFGRYKASYYGHYAMQGFFENLQGNSGTLYVKRMVPNDAVTASTSVNNADTPAEATWKFWAGRLGKKDPGIWGNQLMTTVTASSRGASTIATTTVATDTWVEVVSTAPFQPYDWITVGDSTPATVQIERIDESTNRLYFANADTVGSIFAATQAVAIVDRTVKVYMKDSDTGNIEEVEVISDLSIDPASPYYWVDIINDPYIGSKYIFAEQLTTTAAGTYEDFPVVVADDVANATQFTAGANGTALNTTSMAAQLEYFDPFPVRWLTNTEAFSEAVWDDGEQYCRVRGDTVWVGSPTANQTYDALVVWANKRRRSRKMYAWNNHVWLRVSDPIGIGPNPEKIVPNVGHLMGYAIWINTVRGIHKVPASRLQTPVGIRGLVGNLIDMREITNLANVGLNSISDLGGSYAVRSGRSPSKLKEWWFVNALIMSIYFKKSFEQSFVDLENEPNKAVLLQKIASGMTEFARDFYVSSSNGGGEGGFADGTFTDVVKVIADDTINPIQKVSAGELRANFYFKAPAPAERVLIGVGLLFNG